MQWFSWSWNLEGLPSRGDVVHLITLQHGAGLVNV